MDGINERNHKNSFVHAELHREDQKRKGTFLEGISAKRKYSAQLGERLTGFQTTQNRKKGSAVAEMVDFLNDILG